MRRRNDRSKLVWRNKETGVIMNVAPVNVQPKQMNKEKVGEDLGLKQGEGWQMVTRKSAAKPIKTTTTEERSIDKSNGFNFLTETKNQLARTSSTNGRAEYYNQCVTGYYKGIAEDESCSNRGFEGLASSLFIPT